KLNQRDVNPKKYRRCGRQHGDMETKEARQRRASDVIAATQKPQHGTTDNGNDAGDFCADLSRKESQLIPRQKISAEAETDDNEEQHRAADPGNLARFVISAQKEDAEHVYEQRRDHQVRRPAMDRSNQPPEFNFGDDELNALESILSARTIIKQQQNAGDDLNAKQEHRHAAEVVPDRMTMEWNFLFVRQ